MTGPERSTHRLPFSTAGQPGLFWIIVPFAAVFAGSCITGIESGVWHTFGSASMVLRLAGALWVIAWAAFALRLRGVAGTVGQYVIALLVFGVVLAWASTVTVTAVFSLVNCALDGSAPVTRRARVTAVVEHASAGGSRWFVWIDRTPFGTGAVRVPVNHALYQQLHAGDDVRVTTRRGRLGAEWCPSGACLSGATSPN